MSTSELPRIIGQLYKLVEELESLFPTRHFTPDGHLLGSIGEVVAAHFYTLNLLRHSEAGLDAWTNETPARSVQIKLTAGNRVSLAVTPREADLLIVLRLNRNSGFKEIYNGPYPADLLQEKLESKRREKSLSLSALESSQGERSLDDQGRIEGLNAIFVTNRGSV
jgi:hypothetical protein